jgi:solute carrier family 40 (iron-regulated transporter), member 1
MRRIDLFCKLVGPFAISVLDGVSTRVAIATTLLLNVTSVIIEYYAIKKVITLILDIKPDSHSQVYNDIPALAEPRSIPTTNQRSSSGLTSRLSSLFKELSIYFNHPAFYPSISLALLYFTVLSFGGQMITFLLSSGFKATHIALARIISVAFEISATWLAPFTMRKIGPIRAGLWFINWQALWVTIAGLLFVKINSPFLAALGLVGGVIASRVGLWGFDLCAQVIIQEVRRHSRKT